MCEETETFTTKVTVATPKSDVETGKDNYSRGTGDVGWDFLSIRYIIIFVICNGYKAIFVYPCFAYNFAKVSLQKSTSIGDFNPLFPHNNKVLCANFGCCSCIHFI